MPWNGAGVFNRIYSWVADAAAHINISSSRTDADTDDITSNGFGNCLTRDGQGSPTANLPMNSFRHTGAGAGVAATDYATMGQLQAGMVAWAVATGTADALAAVYSPAIAVLIDGQLCFVRAAFANATTTPTFAPNGLTARTITKLGGTAVAIGDISGAGAELILRYNLASTRWELLNPATVKGTTFWAGAAGGIANAITFTDPNFNNQDGYLLSFRATATNSGPTTANGTAVVKDAPGGPTPCTGTEIVNGNIVTLAYDANASEWHISAPLTLIGAAQLLTSALGVGAPINLQLNASVGSNLLTVAVKGNNGSDPSPINPVLIPFRDATVANGDPVFLTLAAPLSINTFATGATLGSANATAFRFWVVVFNNSGTPVLALINCLLNATGGQIFPLNDRDVASSTAISGSATSAGVFYTPNGTTVSSKALCVLGYIEYNATGLATAGTYNVAPTFVQLAGPNTPRPGAEIKFVRSDTGAVNTGTTAMPAANADTIPTSSQGDQFMSQAITPTSAANVLHVSSQGMFSGSTGGGAMSMALLQDATANSLATVQGWAASTGEIHGLTIDWRFQAQTASSTTLKIRAGLPTSGTTTTFNGIAASRVGGGALNSYLQVREIMA